MARLLVLTFIITLNISCATISPGGSSAKAGDKSAQRVPLPSSQLVALAVAAARQMDEPLQTVVLWVEDSDKNTHSFLIEGNKYGGSIWAMRPGILLLVNGQIREVVFDNVELPLCDCELWESEGMENSCPLAEEPATGTWPRLRDVKSGKLIDLLPPPSTDSDGEVFLGEFSFGAEIIATIGPYLFLKYGDQSVACGAAHGSWFSDFFVYDMSKDKIVDIFSAEEKAAILSNEQQAAFAQIREDPAAHSMAAEDLDFTLIKPTFVSGAGMTLNYQFTAEASFGDSDDNWGAYSRSVIVPAQSIPASLLMYAIIPPALSTFVALSPDIKVGGWIPVTATGQEIKTLVKAFVEIPR